MNKYVPLFIFMATLVACADRNVYKSGNFSTQSEEVHTVAVLPVNITNTGYRPRNVTEEMMNESNERWAYTFQESLYNYLLEHSGRKRKGPMVQFQPLQSTLNILAQNNLKVRDIYTRSPEELSRMLGVDAVILTSLQQHKNMSDGAAYGVFAARTILNQTRYRPATLPLYLSAGNVSIHSYLYKQTKGELLWKTYRQGGTDIPAQEEGIVEYFTNWVARKFPFRS
ncbi:MAG: hypothetical protein JNM68_12885 [Dinghuibacter sp.]|nr:hypothetical protein [Dinghuibacter sp.]